MLKRVIIIIFLIIPFNLYAEEFVLGKDYDKISAGSEQSSESSNTNKVNVVEFFSYGCPWCYRIEPGLMQWVKKQQNKIQFTRVPVVFNKDWSYYAKAYYAVNLLGLNSQLTPLLFKTIQEKSIPLNNSDAMIAFFIAQGVDRKTAESAFKHSTTIDMELNKGTALMAQFNITAVPAIIINNQFKTDLQMAKDEKRLYKLLDYLIQKTSS